ncbi:precorrin-2 dehydrogenase/sirohydrochlorin ferrochelatase family protein [Sphingomonas jatrophae]|uniref:precorrin-2 dehydrogenase n=1 Tax=Sphingomonas jatrophae TaxID=1166337 RepID=A0A1I6LP62_9SPHN|nr:bifunctional precorrin-2 dehydrogenase/sirohydrochlorin ferrochelatase [Sphingomonas jatrophae]SFS05189.1 uroporphyrin-III C-methyltransferase / precorrin-2 dehydrogenase / sirohydrochlorin ferrochelatase [Sphingomonas jatrophae]
MHSLPVFLRLSGRPVILVGTGPAADAKRRLLERAGARIVAETASAALAIVVDDDAAVARLKVRGVLVNAVDRPALCDFTLPAIVDRDPLLIAIGTGGASAGLAKAVRQRIEALLPAGVGGLAARLGALKVALRTRFPDPDARRRALDAAMAEGGPLDPFGDTTDPNSWLAQAGETAPARLVAIPLRSPDPDDLTLRAARLLGHADRIYHPANLAPDILTRARADAERIVGDPPPLPLPGLSLHLVIA